MFVFKNHMRKSCHVQISRISCTASTSPQGSELEWKKKKTWCVMVHMMLNCWLQRLCLWLTFIVSKSWLRRRDLDVSTSRHDMFWDEGPLSALWQAVEFMLVNGVKFFQVVHFSARTCSVSCEQVYQVSKCVPAAVATAIHFQDRRQTALVNSYWSE